MEDEIKFWVNCVPPKSTHQSALRIFKTKDGRQFVGRDKKGLKVARELELLLLPFRPVSPICSPVELCVSWHYPYRKSEPKKNRNKSIPCATRPDADNILKGLIDAMTKVGFWKDDNLIFKLNFEKYFSENSGIGVRIRIDKGR